MENLKQISVGTAWVTTYSDVEQDLVGEVREALLKKGEATFSVCCLDFINEYYLIGDSTEFIIAQELNIPIKLIEYDEDDFIHISEFGYTAEQLSEFVDEKENIRVGDLLDNFLWNGDMYKIETEVFAGIPRYSFTQKEKEMKLITPFESGVEIHKAYIDLEMNEDSDSNIYLGYYINKMKAKSNI